MDDDQDSLPLRDFNQHHGLEWTYSGHKRLCALCDDWIEANTWHLLDLLVSRHYHKSCAEDLFYPLRP